MSPQKIAVLGGYGQLGKTLQNWYQVTNPKQHWYFYGSTEVDITNRGSVDALFKEKGPFDYVVNCAAYTAVDKAEEDHEKAQNCNTRAVGYLAKSCRQENSKLIHISTDFVFDGNLSRPLSETDTPNPLNVYGQTKYEGEQLVNKHLKTHFILRTGWLYSNYGHNFLLTMQRLAKTKTEINVVADQIGTPTHTAVLANVIVNLIETHSEAYGLYHVSNEGVASWYDFAYEIMQLSGSNCRVKPIPSKAYPTPAKRPAFSVLDKSKLKSQFTISLPHWKESLQNCF